MTRDKSGPIVRTATPDASLRATIVSRRPLHYSQDADATLDRPAHVRAASSLAWIGDRIAVIQDDANFIAMIRPDDANVHAIALPAGEGGLRQFDEHRGNKQFKLDLEACVSMDTVDGPQLLAFGSGSTARRRHVAQVDAFHEPALRIVVHDAATWYDALEAETSFAGSDMNIEGALRDGDVLRLFGRGNGKARRGLMPQNATCDVEMGALLHYLADPTARNPPAPVDVVRYMLGAIDDVSLGSTDAALHGAHVLYSAAAEASKDSTRDGTIAGSAIGVIAPSGHVRYAQLTDDYGRTLVDKVEGLVLSPRTPTRAYVVVDPDDAARPSELCEVELGGSWFE